MLANAVLIGEINGKLKVWKPSGNEPETGGMGCWGSEGRRGVRESGGVGGCVAGGGTADHSTEVCDDRGCNVLVQPVGGGGAVL